MIIKDPIHGEINIEQPIIEELIHTIEFQRLRKIKQLGITNLIFPGAEHTRYAHSIGVYYVLNKIIEKFKSKSKIFFTPTEEISILITGLLHDIGHGPLSHSAENFFGYSHEDYTVKIINDDSTEVYQILKKYDKNRNLITHITKFINKTHENYALNSLISSSIDADRMDYLIRDSYYTGAVYGTIDLERIISQIDYDNKKIIFSSKSIHTLEDFILSRYHMFVQVYLNEKSLIYEGVLQKILDRVFVLHTENFTFKTEIQKLLDLNESIEIKKYLEINDYNFLTIISNLEKESDSTLKRLVQTFDKQKKYKKITEREFKKLDFYDFVMLDDYTKKVYSSSDPIYVKDENGNIVTIDKVSPIFQMAKEILGISIKKNVFKIKL